jgi:hypothetical protein
MSFFPAKLRAGMTPRTRELPLAAGAVGLRGALLVQDANGAWATCGANPALIGGIAASDYGPDLSGFNHLAVKGFPPGYMQGISPTDEQPFCCQYLGVLPAADGASYDVILDADGQWKVNFASVANPRVKLVGRRTNSPENLNLVIVTVLPANVQIVV